MRRDDHREGGYMLVIAKVSWHYSSTRSVGNMTWFRAVIAFEDVNKGRGTLLV